jgi:signal transduction histidine kinase
MQHIILQQLDFARICSGDAVFPLKRINLTELCREIALSYYDFLNDNHFQVSLDLNDPPIYTTTSSDAIRCIMQNLIDNSIKYGESGKFLGIAISQTDQEIIIQVSDHGPGIPPAEQKKIFNRNYQINKSDYSTQGRAGLGLSFVEKIAARCHMSIQLESKPGDTCFSVIVRKTLEK